MFFPFPISLCLSSNHEVSPPCNLYLISSEMVSFRWTDFKTTFSRCTLVTISESLSDVFNSFYWTTLCVVHNSDDRLRYIMCLRSKKKMGRLRCKLSVKCQTHSVINKIISPFYLKSYIRDELKVWSNSTSQTGQTLHMSLWGKNWTKRRNEK